MTQPRRPLTSLGRRHLLLGALATPLLAACGGGESSAGGGETPVLKISAIPDQDPELLNRLYGQVATCMEAATDLDVEYVPVTDYTAVVRAFQRGDLSLVWMGGLTGVQARELVPGATAIAQRDIDVAFTSYFIANKSSGLQPFDDVSGLTELAGHSFTFGSETSTSGRLMPQYFMDQAGLDLADLEGEPGFSGSHDATLEAVASGAFEVGALNSQVFDSAKEAGDVDLSDVVVLFQTPGYADYHWLVRPDVDDIYGEGTTQALQDFLLGLDEGNAKEKEILELFGASEFIEADDAAYDQIEQVAREQDLLL